MARHGRLCHASLARCSQNLPRRMCCRQGASRSSTKVGLGAGCPTGHRPYDRSRRDTGCCRLRGRPRAIPPGFRAGSCRPCGLASYKSGIDACANESDAEPNAQIINPLGIGTQQSYSASWVLWSCPVSADGSGRGLRVCGTAAKTNELADTHRLAVKIVSARPGPCTNIAPDRPSGRMQR
jgi:hypothetical protein